MILYQYECRRCAHQFENLTSLSERDKQITCSCCGGNARRIVTPVRSQLDGTDDAFTTAGDRWARIHEQEAKREPRDDYSNLSPSQVKSLKGH